MKTPIGIIAQPPRSRLRFIPPFMALQASAEQTDRTHRSSKEKTAVASLSYKLNYLPLQSFSFTSNFPQ